MICTELEKYVEILNEINNKLGKRKRSNIVEYDTVLNEIQIKVFLTLLAMDNNYLEYKNKNLYNFVDHLKNIVNNHLSLYKDDNKLLTLFNNNINTTSDIYKIFKHMSIAILSLTLQILNEIQKYSNINKNLSYYDCIINIRERINNFIYNKKRKIDTNLKNVQTNNVLIYNHTEENNEGIELINKLFINNIKSVPQEIISYYIESSIIEKKNIINQIKSIINNGTNDIPIAFKIMNLPIELDQKYHIINIYKHLISSDHSEAKLKTWLDGLMTIPFGKYDGINLGSLQPNDIKIFLNSLESIMNKVVYGHDDAKRQIIQIMGQEVRNPNTKGNIIGLWGPPGNGKTTLIKDGIAVAMNKPFIFIPLGGATDASFLEGHSYTYEGSIYGRIVNGLITSKCMNPIIYFDELDKISKTPKGEEISNILVHITDPAQNSHFRDKYFHGIDIDLSKATIIFSFNNPNNINPILLDRITMIETKFLLAKQKIHIAQNYMLYDILKNIGFKNNDIKINNDTLKYLIMTYTREGGIRKLKSLLYTIVREINLAYLLKTTINNDNIVLPFTITINHIKYLLKNKHEI